MICTSVQPCGSKQEQFPKSDSFPMIDENEFQDLIRKIKTEDYRSGFLKLGTRFLPDCYYSAECEEKHEEAIINARQEIKMSFANDKHSLHLFDKNQHTKDGIPTGMDYYTNTSIYNMLQQPLEHWEDHVDFAAAIKMVISHSKYLSGDILRILFDYILRGPTEEIMESITDIIKQHLVHHPPCLIELRKYYQQCLFEPDDECYFKTELSTTGVLLHVLHKLKEMEKFVSNVTVPEPAIEPTGEMTLEMLEERWETFQPMVEPELDETLAVINGLRNYFISKAPDVLNEDKLFKRLIIALEAIVNILECDFLICGGKLKTYLDKGKSGTQNSDQIRIPIIQCFTYPHFGKVLSIYKNTKEKSLWMQLSRLIVLMIETEHVFDDAQKTNWNYPNLNSKCLNLVDELIKAFTTSEWDSDEKMIRLKFLPQAWLRQRVAMACCNAEVKGDYGLDIEALVEIIHMHVKSPISLEKESLEVTTDFEHSGEDISKLSKKAKLENDEDISKLSKKAKLENEEDISKLSKKAKLENDEDISKLSKKTKLENDEDISKLSKKPKLENEGISKLSKKAKLENDEDTSKLSKKDKLENDEGISKLSKKAKLENDEDVSKLSKKAKLENDEDTSKLSKKAKLKNDEDISKLSKKAKLKNGASLLLSLCRQRNSSLSSIENVLNMPDCDINKPDNHGWTALHEAVHRNSIMKVKLLLQYKQSPGKKPLNIVAQNVDGITPLHDAVFKKNLQICELLLEYGGVSLLRVANSKGVTPLDLAKGKPEIQHLFKKKIGMQEGLIMRSDSGLNLPDNIILILKIAFDAFNEQYHTTHIHDILKHKIPFLKVKSLNALVVDNDTILEYKNHQDQLRKLRRIISNLAKNPQNSYLIKVWDSQLNKVFNERVNQ